MIDIEKLFGIPVAPPPTEAERWLDIFNKSPAIGILKNQLTQRLLTTYSSGYSANSLWKSWKFYDGSRFNYCELSGLMVVQ